MEEKIYERQVTKQVISKRVIDEQQIDRHYNLQELYNFAYTLKKFEDMIYKYHEHDTLLENKEEETLDEAERKQLWEKFETEKS
jgi:transcriptional regulator ATRX